MGAVLVNIFDEKNGRIIASGNNTTNIFIENVGYFDCNTHLLSLFSTDRKSSFYQEKFNIKINDNMSFKYDAKRKRASFCFEYSKLNMPSVDLDLPLVDRNENAKNIDLVSRVNRTNFGCNKNVIAVYLAQQRSKIKNLLKEMNNARQGMVNKKNKKNLNALKVKKTESDVKIQEKLQTAMQRNGNASLSYFLPILKIHSEPKSPKKLSNLL